MHDVTKRHPEFTELAIRDWELVSDAMAGESTIKFRREKYLPKPPGFNNPKFASRQYNAYLERATFPEIFEPTVSAMLGIIHKSDASFEYEIPPGLEFFRESSNRHGSPLEVFHKKVTRHILVSGRGGILTDIEQGQLYFSLYHGSSIINWDKDFFVLDESGFERDRFKWDKVEEYRVLEMENGIYKASVYRKTKQGGMTNTAATPTALGGVEMKFVPFVAFNSVDTTPAIMRPPLIGVATAAKAIYQLTADQRHQLFNSAWEILVAINGDLPDKIGAGVGHEMYGSPETGAPDLKFVSPACATIEAHEDKIESYRKEAVDAGARMFNDSAPSQESGEARKLRFAAQTASLASVAQVSAAVIEQSLRFAARMKGIDEKTVSVSPPKELLKEKMSPQDALALFQIWEKSGFSYETLYTNWQAGGLVSPDRSADDEFDLITAEQANGITSVANGDI